jgi:hypothetical protein
MSIANTHCLEEKALVISHHERVGVLLLIIICMGNLAR